jgi:NTE family protein
VINKNLFFIDTYPMNIEKLPDNLSDVYHRARDIKFSDKTQRQIRMAKVVTRYLKYIEELYQIIEKNIDPAKIDKKQLEKIRHTYRKVKRERGAEIKNIIHIIRDEPFPYFNEDIDFSLETIRNSIKHGESKTNQILEKTSLIN